ncbi:MAG: hypothetical protein NVS9B15_04760 [Acidobacteriaceae bacterium]
MAVQGTFLDYFCLPVTFASFAFGLTNFGTLPPFPLLCVGYGTKANTASTVIPVELGVWFLFAADGACPHVSILTDALE